MTVQRLLMYAAMAVLAYVVAFACVATMGVAE